MNRPQIEKCAILFTIALVCMFFYALYRVGLQTGIIGG